MAEAAHIQMLPRIVRADRESTLRFALPESMLLMSPGEYGVVVRPRGRVTGDDEIVPDRDVSGGIMRLTCVFPAEQEHTILIRRSAPDDRGRTETLGVGSVYSLEDDLFGLRPYKGDLHMHSNRSDGGDEPSHVPAACRRIGLDFMALTDHRLYQPSLDAMAAFDGLELDLKMFPGEEVHAPDSDVHIINFGGSFSVNDLFKSDKDAYEREVRAIERALPPGLNEKDGRRYAAAVWCYRKIRQAGGLSIFCHPYWIYQSRDNVSELLVDRHLQEMPFDALEVIGGFHLCEAESNIRQVARYHEERAKGRDVPIVGVSDAHGCETGKLFGWYYTIIFAASCEFDDIVGAIRGLRSVAVEALPLPDATPRAHGPYRLTCYAQFLMREFFPGHDDLCRKEGELMQAHARGDKHAAPELALLRGQTAAYMAKCFDSLAAGAE